MIYVNAESIVGIIFCYAVAYDKHESCIYNCSTRTGANRQPVADSPTLTVDEPGNRVLCIPS